MKNFMRKMSLYIIYGLYILLVIGLTISLINTHKKVDNLNIELDTIRKTYDDLTQESNTKYDNYEIVIDNLKKTIDENNNEIVKLQQEIDCLNKATIEIEQVKDTTEEINNTEIIEETEQSNTTYLGNYELTAYIETGNPCADGVYPQINYTVACNDPNLWHKWIYIEGYGEYYVHDVGGMPTYNIIDIYVGDYDSAIQFGRRNADVYLIE